MRSTITPKPSCSRTWASAGAAHRSVISDLTGRRTRSALRSRCCRCPRSPAPGSRSMSGASTPTAFARSTTTPNIRMRARPSPHPTHPNDRTRQMTDRTIDLDQHRGMAAQKATNQRRMLAEFEASRRALRLRQDELETQLLAAPAATWPEAAQKARYLLKLFVDTAAAEDPRRQRLIAAVLADLDRLSSEAT